MQWSTAVSLLKRDLDLITPEYDSACASAALSNDCIYVLADYEFDLYGQRAEFSQLYVCTLNTIFKSCEPKFRGEIPKQDLSISGTKWNKVASHKKGSTCITIDNQLFAIGGADLEEILSYDIQYPDYKTKPLREVCKYNPDQASWKEISTCIVPRFSCFATMLSLNEILVVGGCNSDGNTVLPPQPDFVDTVEKATVTVL